MKRRGATSEVGCGDGELAAGRNDWDSDHELAVVAVDSHPCSSFCTPVLGSTSFSKMLAGNFLLLQLQNPYSPSRSATPLGRLQEDGFSFSRGVSGENLWSSNSSVAGVFVEADEDEHGLLFPFKSELDLSSLPYALFLHHPRDLFSMILSLVCEILGNDLFSTRLDQTIGYIEDIAKEAKRAIEDDDAYNGQAGTMINLWNPHYSLDLKTVLEQTRKGVITSIIFDELIDKLKGLSLTEKPKEKKGQLRGFHDPYKILEEEQTKLKKQEEGTMSLIVFRDNRWIGDQAILATMEVDLTQGSQLVYVIPNIMLTIGDFYRNIQVYILTRGYDQWRGGEANLLITRDGGEELLAVGIDTTAGPEDGGEELLAAGPAEPVETNMDYPNLRRLMYQQEG
ncbi:hypothetical protein ZIOFF_014951 [Zingiber officinale]|uniref:Uncharacterized protein n=1 Tax=Zingiber officinale TaxID=94328 RepID=A0A8J5LSP5_ZINOF|nr:hypothetical protein ZIOFF_014951 [Zingiber officinale]